MAKFWSCINDQIFWILQRTKYIYGTNFYRPKFLRTKILPDQVFMNQNYVALDISRQVGLANRIRIAQSLNHPWNLQASTVCRTWEWRIDRYRPSSMTRLTREEQMIEQRRWASTWWTREKQRIEQWPLQVCSTYPSCWYTDIGLTQTIAWATKRTSALPFVLRAIRYGALFAVVFWIQITCFILWHQCLRTRLHQNSFLAPTALTAVI